MKLFDLDGTLIDSTGIWRQVDHQFLSHHNLEMTDEYMTNITRSTFPVAAQYTKEYYHLDLTPEAIIEEWTSLVKKAYEHQIPLKPGVRKYLELCFSSGEPMALVTSCAPELGLAVLNRHGIASLFRRLFFAQELGIEKRDPRFFQHVLAHLNVSPSECTLYEDAPENIAIGKEMGMTVIGVLDPLYENEKIRMHQICDRCIHDFTELL